MAFKRLIALVPVKNGQVVMSYGYLRHRPVGSLRTVLKNLDRWGIDEIAVIDISRNIKNPDLSILEQIRASGVRTPIAFGGGIRSASDALEAVAKGCDRVIVETLLWQDPKEIDRIAASIGQQAIIGAVPLVIGSKGLSVAPVNALLNESFIDFIDYVNDLSISELMIIDRANEGLAGSNQISKYMPIIDNIHKFIWFGGLNPSLSAELLKRPDTVGVAFGNQLLAKELAINTYRSEINAHSRQQLIRKVLPNGGE